MLVCVRIVCSYDSFLGFVVIGFYLFICCICLFERFFFVFALLQLRFVLRFSFCSSHHIQISIKKLFLIHFATLYAVCVVDVRDFAHIVLLLFLALPWFRSDLLWYCVAVFRLIRCCCVSIILFFCIIIVCKKLYALYLLLLIFFAKICGTGLMCIHMRISAQFSRLFKSIWLHSLEIPYHHHYYRPERERARTGLDYLRALRLCLSFSRFSAWRKFRKLYGYNY